MKWKFLSIFSVFVFALAACQATDGNQQGRDAGNRDGNNVEQTRYNNNTSNDLRNTPGYDNRQDRNRNEQTNRDRDRRRNDDTRHKGQDGDNARNNGENRYEVAEEAADRITDEIDEIDYAYVLTTNNNAYVAAALDNDRKTHDTDNYRDGRATLDRNNDENRGRTRNRGDDRAGEELTDDVKSEISDVVKSVDDNIDNVYVSTNPDFVDLTNNYVDDMNNGRPIRGFVDEFSNMIERLFPQNRDNR
ncbi:MAG TPA: YhcN/YlaJ family sporulation lipoprotein [Bacillota bacterium]|nr:YhcN/YlaJ family sporulation lipoprotein [Bacillota bacterium]